MTTLSRHVMSRQIMTQCQDDKPKHMDTVSFSDYDTDIVEYIAGSVLHHTIM